MPQRTVTLIRHGQCFQAGKDPSLTELGYQQAVATASVFKGQTIGTIYYSTLQRTREQRKLSRNSYRMPLLLDMIVYGKVF